MEQTSDRKLLAILFADIAGYTALMQENEVKAKASLRDFRELARSITEESGGRIVHFYGDGCICTFESSVKALQCATSLQSRFIRYEIPVRIGLHSGDVFFDDHNVYGDTVNIASRIESMALPGSVLFSGRVKRDIQNQPGLEYHRLGSFALKNITEPVDVYSLVADGITAAGSGCISGLTWISSREITMRRSGRARSWLITRQLNGGLICSSGHISNQANGKNLTQH